MGCFSALFPKCPRAPGIANAISPALPSPAAVPIKCALAVDAPPPYFHAGSPIFRPDVLRTIEETIAKLDADLRGLNLDIHDHPEIMWEERHAHDALTAFMAARGFNVTRAYLGLPTAWRATFAHGKGGRVLGVNSEMDALPGIGHACGHNLIAVAGVGIALAIAAALVAHDIPGQVVLLGTPAEEGGAGKVVLLERGAYAGMDACMMAHPTVGAPRSATVRPTNAIQPVTVEYHGHTAHAGAQPWEGQNALDAAFVAYTAVSALRQQIKPTHRVHGIVEGRDWAPNIIPDYAKMRWLVRAPTADETGALAARVVACLEAAALATSCKPVITKGILMKDLHQNLTLGTEFATTLGKYDMETSVGNDGGSSASTDFGNITYALPAVHPGYAIPSEPNGGNHTPAFTAAARTAAAHALTLQVVQALALTGVRVLADDAFFAAVKKEYDDFAAGA